MHLLININISHTYSTLQISNELPSGPSSGTSATAMPNSSGKFVEPVYYDWGDNWDQVSELVETAEVQSILMSCVNGVTDGYYFNEWDESKIWPFLFIGHRRYGNGEHEALMKKFLLPLQIKELNRSAADHMQSEGDTYIRNIAETCVKMELEEGVEMNEASIDEVIEADDMVETLYETESWSRDVHEAAEAILYAKNGPGSVRDVLLCTMGASFDFMPLNYILAKLVSPDDADLKVVAGSNYSVVFDEQRNIVFDNFWYFCDKISAAKLLEVSRKQPLSTDEFDKRGGLAN